MTPDAGGAGLVRALGRSQAAKDHSDHLAGSFQVGEPFHAETSSG